MQNKFISFTYYAHGQRDYVIPHRHEYLEIVYYGFGEGRTTVDAETYSYSDDTLAIIPPGTVHDEFAVTATNVYCLVLQPEEGIFYNQVIAKDGENCGLMHKLLQSLKAIQNSYGNWITRSNEYLDSELALIVLYVMQLMKLKESRQKEYAKQAVDYCMSYLKNNCRYGLNLAVISERLGYSYDRFRHLFKEYTGETLYQYLSGVRLSKSKELLKNPGIPIGNVARRCGFKSPVRFSNWFKEKTGVSPQSYRDILRRDLQNGVYRPGAPN